ncbi:PREDICTED: intercellular adhesion molecule 4-like [Gekko japonicus]|uniref:Intercellular adhesion molecule 4-like n=1 Tax=Gekko japonicus TaxID=146911 RepID=A0ABM1L3E3_GEKJA|nr:PREDICTED: intercellular adhesion molecule 4-like [Gekko japonicus]
MVEFGSSVVINCSTNCPHPTSGDLETSLEKEAVGNGSRWRAFRLLNVSHWDPVPLCYFECPDAGDMEPQRANFTVYRPPKLVLLDPVPVIVVGENYTLTCRVSSVAPIRKLSVAFLQGRETVHLRTFENRTELEASDVVVNHTVTARRAVYGEVIRCDAVLDLRPDGPVVGKASSFNQMLTVMDYTAISVAIASIATLALILVGTGIYSYCPRKQ